MAEAYARLSIQGSLPGGEVWSVNPAFRESPGGALDDLYAQWATAVAAAFADSPSLLPQQLSQLLTSSATIDNIRVSRYGTTGDLLWYHDAPLANKKAGTGTLSGPTTQALVFSLSAGLFARTGRGRLFWPALTYPVDTSSGRVTKGTLPQMLSDFRTMIVGIENAAPSGISPTLAVYSAKLGVAQPVNSLRVGDVMDSQRRRKDALKESYAQLAM